MAKTHARALMLSIMGLVGCSSASDQPAPIADANGGHDAAAALDAAVPPTPDAMPAQQGFTAARHWDNSNPIDWYPNGETGPHKGWELRLPYGSTVARMQTASPIGTTMYTAIVTLDAPVPTATGQMIRVMWFTHVRGDLVQGHRNAGETVATCWDSGIEFENVGIVAEAAHFHVGASTTNVDPNGTGNIPGIDALRAMGFHPRIVLRIPGPMDYFSGAWFRGKPKTMQLTDGVPAALRTLAVEMEHAH